jgi:hypothetical protein
MGGRRGAADRPGPVGCGVVRRRQAGVRRAHGERAPPASDRWPPRADRRRVADGRRPAGRQPRGARAGRASPERIDRVARPPGRPARSSRRRRQLPAAPAAALHHRQRSRCATPPPARTTARQSPRQRSPSVRVYPGMPAEAHGTSW